MIEDTERYTVEDMRAAFPAVAKSKKARPLPFAADAVKANAAFSAGINDPQRDFEVAQAALRNLAPWRCDDYSAWRDTGYILFNTFGNDPEAFTLYEAWSKTSNKYQSGKCKDRWDEAANRSLNDTRANLGTLIAWAKEDSPIFVTWFDALNGDTRIEHAQVRAQENALTDIGNARRFVERHGENTRFDYAHNLWLSFTGEKWTEGKCAVEQFAKETVRHGIASEAASTEDPEKRAKIYKHAAGSQSARAVKAMLDLAKSEQEIQANVADFDSQPHLFNVKNGTLNLRTGDLQPHRREDLITKQVPINYDPRATCPQTDKFLKRIFGGVESLIDFFWRMLGYILTGETSENCFFLFHGDGANGKTVALNLIAALTGPYGTTLRTEALMLHKWSSANGHNEDIASLRGKRFVAACETNAGQRFNESQLKQLTGGDIITASRKHEHNITFKSMFKLCLAANHKPDVEGTDEGIWRRVRLIPFEVTIPKSERDPYLTEKLMAELPGILARAVTGAVEFYRNGLGVPSQVEAATKAYRDEQDTLAVFLADVCDAHPALTAPSQTLYTKYAMWCEGNGERPKTIKAFSTMMKAHGFTSARTKHGIVWQGVRPKPPTSFLSRDTAHLKSVPADETNEAVN